ncbi:hypothetical protein L1887_28101 [Cichorium endivia]|nr:hypothetical protein L1887_28101 [Cichorium endivia]
MEIFHHILKIQSFGIFRESEYPFLRDARGEILGHVPLYWHFLCEPPLVCRCSEGTFLSMLFSFDDSFTPTVFRPGVKSIKMPYGLYLVLRTVPTPTVPLEHEFFLKELFFYRYSGIASETTLLIRFCVSCTSFEVLELFKVSIQSLILISKAIFVISNDKYREVQTIVFCLKIRAIHSN